VRLSLDRFDPNVLLHAGLSATTGQIVPMNPAAAVRGPKHVVKTGKTPVLEGEEWRKLLASIPTTTLRDLRDRALIATLTYSFARITAALKMKVEDLRPRGAGWTVRLHEKGGKQHAMPCHHALAEALRAYIDAAGIAEDRKGWLFRTARGHKADTLSDRAMNQSDAWCMIRRRAKAAGIAAEIGCHTFRATGITAYLANGGALEHAQEMAAHESPRTTKLYDRTKERLTQGHAVPRRGPSPRYRSSGAGGLAGSKPSRQPGEVPSAGAFCRRNSAIPVGLPDIVSPRWRSFRRFDRASPADGSNFCHLAKIFAF
jgi:integrase